MAGGKESRRERSQEVHQTSCFAGEHSAGRAAAWQPKVQRETTFSEARLAEATGSTAEGGTQGGSGHWR
jgi:hypothetical protein